MARVIVTSCVLGVVLLAGCVSEISKGEARAALLRLHKNALAQVRQLNLQVDDQELCVSYLEAGDPAKREIVFIHGTPASSFSWVDVMHGNQSSREGLAADYHTLAIDLPGHGLSGSLSSYSWETMVEFVVAFLEAVGAERVCLVGNSYGGEVAWRSALARPDLVEDLVLIGSSGYHRSIWERGPLDVILMTPLVGGLASQFTWRWLVRTGLEQSYYDSSKVTDDLVDERYTVIRAAGNRPAMVAMNRIENGDGAESIPLISQDTLLIWSFEDPLFDFHDHGLRFRNDIPRSRLVPISQCGHSVQEERPEVVVAEIRQHLERGQ